MSNNVMDYEDAKIAAWLLTGLRHEAIRLGKKYEKIKFYELPVLNKKINEDFEEIEIIDTIKSNSDTLLEAESAVFVESALSLLTEKQQKVIIATIIQQHREKEVAKDLGISQPAVQRLKARSLKKLKRNILENPTAKLSFQDFN